MLNKRHHKILIDMLSLPTAPFTEDYVREYIFDFCNPRNNVRVREDKAGNILVHYKHPSTRIARPVCLCAHTDHPGFRAGRMIADGVLEAQWHGGVPKEYFPNAKVRFFSEGQWVYGRLKRIHHKMLGLEKPEKRVHSVEVEIRRPRGALVKPGSPGMWDLPDPQIKGQKIHARGCDDIAGCSGMLACLETLVRNRARTEAYFLFTRAEEVGFIGAIAACDLRTIPKRCLVVAIETSSVIPGVVMGAGPILRVGDKSSVFTPDLTAWCRQVAEDLARKERTFKYQRKLMDGGSCESTAYCLLGYEATGVCLALGNYHNCDKKRKKLAPEYIHLHDLAHMIKWFVAMATTRAPVVEGNPALRKRLGQLKRRYQRLLKATA